MSKLRLISLPIIGIAVVAIAGEYVADRSVAAVVNAPLAVIRRQLKER